MKIIRTVIQHISFLALSVLLVTACGPSKRITSAEQAVDDGESNVVVFSYDLTLDSARKYEPVIYTELHFLCPESDGIDPVCFSTDLVYTGYVKKPEYTAHEFRAAGSQALSMKYGQYTIDDVNNSVLVDRIVDIECYNRPGRLNADGRRGRVRHRCEKVYNDIKIYHKAKLPAPLSFDVKSGLGCYLGHVKLRMYKNSIVEYDFQPGVTMTTEILRELPQEIRAAVSKDVQNPC